MNLPKIKNKSSVRFPFQMHRVPEPGKLVKSLTKHDDLSTEGQNCACHSLKMISIAKEQFMCLSEFAEAVSDTSFFTEK